MRAFTRTYYGCGCTSDSELSPCAYSHYFGGHCRDEECFKERVGHKCSSCKRGRPWDI